MSSFTRHSTLIALLVSTLTAVSAVEQVRVEFANHANAGGSLEDRYGDYCPTKILYADRIYDRAKVLDPTQMPFTRFEWPEDIRSTDPDRIDPRMFDGRPSQETILKQLFAAGVRPLVCIRVPPHFKNDMGDIETYYRNVVKKVVSIANGRKVDIELFNEPDLMTLDRSGSAHAGDAIDRSNQDAFIRRFAAAYQGASPERRANVTIGGPGFALSGFGDNQWMGRFLAEVDQRNFRLDFVSYHIYLGWSDDDRIASASADKHLRRAQRVQDQVEAFSRRSGMRAPPVWITEYAWCFGDPRDAFPRNRATMFNHQFCARTLESFLLGRELAGVQRLYWAQGPGQHLPEIGIVGDGATFFSMINYHRERNGSEKWLYKSGVPAFHFINTLPGSRSRVTTSDALGAIASSNGTTHALAVWSRGGTREVDFAFPGLGDLSRYDCSVREVEQGTWDPNRPQPTAKRMRLSQLGEVRLGNEASLFLDITTREEDEEEGLSAIYFNDKELTQEGHRRIDRTVDFRWRRDAPAPRIDAETFSVRWTGSVIAPRDGDYVFSTHSDDGIRVWIDGRKVIDQWNRHRERGDHSPTLRLTKGRHRIRIEYFDNHLTAICVVSWRGPGFSRQVIPRQALRSKEP